MAARRPAYVAVTSSSSSVGISARPLASRNSKPASEVPVAVRSSRSSDGRAEHDVAVDGGADQHPLAARGRHRQHDARHQRAGELVEDEQLAAARRDGEAVVPNIGSTSSAPRPAALTTQRAGPRRGWSAAWCRPSPRRRPVTRAPRQQSRAARHGVGGQREVGRPGADDRLVGHGEPAECTRAEVGHAPVDLVGADDLAAVVPVGVRPWPAGRAARRVPRRSRRRGARRCARPGCRSARRTSPSSS